MLRFLFSAGSDACDSALVARIKADLAAGDKVILLVPEQETVVAERHWLDTLSPTAQLSFEVSNFTRLANRTFRTVGGLSYRYATDGIRALLMWRTLKTLSPTLTHYADAAANDPHLTDRMLSAVTQFKAYAVSADALSQVVAEMGDDTPLHSKLSDLAKIYAAYQGELAKSFDDMADDLARARKLIEETPTLYADTHIYIDSFTDFTGEELKLCRTLAKRAKSLTFTTPLQAPGDKGLHLKSARATFERLRSIATRELHMLPQNSFFPLGKSQNALAYLAENLFEMDAEPAPLGMQETGEIVVTSAASPFEEAEYAAATVAALVRAGCRYRDIALIVRNAAHYTGILDAALEKEGIPYFLSEKTDITVRPLIKLILFALRIKRYNWQKEDVVGYLKTGLCGVTADDVNFFEEYAEVWKLQGAAVYQKEFMMSADGYRGAPTARAVRILAGANRAREALTPPLAALFTALDAATAVKEQCAAIYAFLKTLGVPEAMKARAAALLARDERREAEESTRLWSVLVDALEAIATVSDTAFSIDDLMTALQLVFSRTDVGTIPTRVDEVMIGSAATLRAAPVRYALILGLNEGLFPEAIKETGLLSDAEKDKLAEFDIHLSARTDTMASDELFYLTRAFSLPTERLYLSYTETTGDGKKAMPSIALRRTEALFPDLFSAAIVKENGSVKRLRKNLAFADRPAITRIFSLSAALESLRESDADTRAALLSLLGKDRTHAEKITHLHTPMQDTAAEISPARAETIFHPGAFNPTGIEHFSSCPFAYYCREVLGLREEPTDTLDSAAVGNFIHAVLEKTLEVIKESKKSPDDLTEAERTDIVNKSIAAYRARLIEIGGGLSPRAEALLTRLADLARIVAGALLAELADSSFRPAFLELDLKKLTQKAALTLGDGSRIPLTGRIDRVDSYKDENGHVYLRVTDYKTGRKTFKRAEIAEGFGLQLPLYLYALCKGKQQELLTALQPTDGILHPAGVTYISTAISTERTDARISPDEAKRLAAARLGRSGLLPDDLSLLHAVSHSDNKALVKKGFTHASPADFADLFTELETTVTRIAGDMRSGNAAAHPKKREKRSPCTYCAFAPVCRTAEKDKFKGD